VDKFIQIIRENNLRSEQIDKVIAYLRPTSPCDDTLVTQEDVFFNLRYQIACAAHGIQVSHWHDLDIMKSPKVIGFLPKVAFEKSSSASGDIETGAEVFVNGKSFKALGDCKDGVCIIRRLAEEEFIRKFEENCSDVLPQDKRNRLVGKLLELDRLEDVSLLMQLATP
jgi:hypothetical protein